MISAYEQVLNLCLEQFDKPLKASSLIDLQCIKQRISVNGQVFDLLYDLKQGSGRHLTDCALTIKLFKTGANYTGSPLASDSLNGQNLGFILKRLHALEVVPTSLPITALVHAGYLVNFVLHKFVRVGLSD